MRKIISVILAILLLFSITSCNNTADKKNNEETESVNSINYSGILHIKINPEFKVYFDKNFKVTSVEAINDDAKSFFDKIEYSNLNLEDTINNIIIESNKAGFIHENSIIHFDVNNIVDNSIDANEVIKKVTDVANETASKIDIQIEIVAETYAIDTDNKTNEDETDDVNEKKAQSESKTHVHNFSNATCTKPSVCSCGETTGNALGHDWKAATCKEPKTCQRCNEVEGSTVSHNYINGVCNMCGASIFISPKTNLKYDKEYLGNFSETSDGLVGYGISFITGCYDSCIVIPAYYAKTSQYDGQKPLVFNGKSYYHEAAGQDMHRAEINDKEIVIYESLLGEDLYTAGGSIHLKMQNDGKLIVSESTSKYFPVGVILELT